MERPINDDSRLMEIDTSKVANHSNAYTPTIHNYTGFCSLSIKRRYSREKTIVYITETTWYAEIR